MKNVADAVVVGGGPCGSFAACNLARLGVSVAILEEHAEIGTPSHCAGHLSISGLQRMGLWPLPSGIIENVFQGAVFHSPKGKSFSVRFPSQMTCVVSRVLFDRYLAERAEKAGAQCCLASRAESLAVDNGSVRGVVVKRDAGTEVLSTKVVVDAEGASSNIVKKAGLAAVDRRRTVNGVEAEVEGVQGVEPDMVEVFVGRNYAPGLYAWLIPRRDGTAKVGLATRSGNPKNMLQRFMLNHPSACEKLGKARISKMAFHPVPLGGPIPKVFADGFLAVGDAASHVKPTTGGGVILGLTCARAAAEVVSEAVARGDFSADFLSCYQRRCDKIMSFDMRVMLQIRQMLDAMSDERLDSAVSFCARFGLDKVFQDSGDFDFQGRSLLKLLRNPKVAPALAYFLFLCLSANP